MNRNIIYVIPCKKPLKNHKVDLSHLPQIDMS